MAAGSGSCSRLLLLGRHNLVIKKRVHLGVRKDYITGCDDGKDMRCPWSSRAKSSKSNCCCLSTAELTTTLLYGRAITDL